MSKGIKPDSSTHAARWDLKTKVQKRDPKKPGWPISPETAKAAQATMEPTFDTWSPDDVVLASLALGELRSAIDAVKAAADKLHRARKCPDRMLFAQINLADLSSVIHSTKQLERAYENARIKTGARHGG